MNVIATEHAPAAIGPYSQAISAGGFVFCSGQLGLDPVTGQMAAPDAAAQARQALANLSAVLIAAGSSLRDVVKTTVFLADMGDFAAVNAIYEAAFGGHKPARACVQAARLPKDARVEIECVAVGPRCAG
jgi:2-iminobutanoate/2-iminopropanoate deaminase